MKTKYFIFNLMFGSYESAVHIFKGETIQEIVKNNEELQDCNIRDYNYNPEIDIDKFSYMNNYHNPLFTNISFRDDKYKTHPVFDNDYETLLKNSPDYNNGYNKGVSSKFFLKTNKEFYDWVEIYGNFPENYKFSDGHSG